MSRSQHVISHLPDLRRATRIRPGTDPFRPVYGRSVKSDYGLSPHMYADDTQVYGFCGSTAATTLTANITALKQPRPGCDQTGASTKSRQDRVPVLCDRPTTTSTANVTAADRRLLHHSGPVCSRPRHLRRLRLVDADARSTYRVTMLRCAVPQLYVRFVALYHRPHFRC